MARTCNHDTNLLEVTQALHQPMSPKTCDHCADVGEVLVNSFTEPHTEPQATGRFLSYVDVSHVYHLSSFDQSS